MVVVGAGQDSQFLSELNELSIHGKGKTWNKSDIERMMHKMVIDGLIEEEMMIFNEIACAYIRIGPKANEFMTSKDSKVRIVIYLRHLCRWR